MNEPLFLNTTCLMTGGSGYVGSRLLRALQAKGVTVSALSREPMNGVEITRYALGDALPPPSCFNVDVFIHCSYDFSLREWDEIYEKNVAASIALFRLAHSAGVKKLIFISSISAFEGCKSLYGRAKLLVEKEVLRLGGIVIRPGLVYGPQAGGILGAMRKVVMKLPVVPMIGSGNQPLFVCPEEILCKAVIRAAFLSDDMPALSVIASPEPTSFRKLLKEIAQSAGRRVYFLVIPSKVVWLGLKFLEGLNIHLPFRSDSVVSLLHADPNPPLLNT